jgi:hypothetical protein
MKPFTKLTSIKAFKDIGARMPTSARICRPSNLADVGIRAPILFSTALLAVVQTANAHPGHGLLEHGAAHVITSPYHLMILATMGVAMIAIARIVRSRSAQRNMRIAGVGAVIAAGLLCALGY